MWSSCVRPQPCLLARPVITSVYMGPRHMDPTLGVRGSAVSWIWISE